MFEIEINKINTQLEEIKNKVNDGMTYYFAQFEVEKLLKEANVKFVVWSSFDFVDKEYILSLKSLINQVSQFLQDLNDLIEIEKGKTY